MSKKVEPVFAGYRDDKFVAAMPDWGNLSHRHDAEGGLTIVDAVIVPLAEWERVKGFYDRIERDYPDFHRDILAAMELLK